MNENDKLEQELREFYKDDGLQELVDAIDPPPVIKETQKIVRVEVPAPDAKAVVPDTPVPASGKGDADVTVPEAALRPTQGSDTDRGEAKPGPAMHFMAVKEPVDYVEPDWARYAFDILPKMPGTQAVLAEGPRGTGKTLLAQVLAHRLGRPLLIVNCQPDMTAEMMLGTVRVSGGTDYWSPGPIMLAAKHNAVLCLDEFNVLPSAAQLGIKPICDSTIHGLFIPHTGERVEWPNPTVIACVNPDYAGTRTIQEACRDVMTTLVADYLPEGKEVEIVVGRTGCPQGEAERAVRTANAIRAAAHPAADDATLPLQFDLSPRALIAYGHRLALGDRPNAAWQGEVINRVGTGFSTSATRQTVIQLSQSIGNFQNLK